jgi:hypothetical protein
MSALYVRQTVREWLGKAEIDVPFYDTINRDQTPTDDIWATASFDATFRERLTFCNSSWQEEGDVNVVYTGLPGIGDAVVLAAAEKDMQTLMSIRDPNDKLRLTAVDPPREASAGSTNQGYQVSYLVEYEYQEGKP